MSIQASARKIALMSVEKLEALAKIGLVGTVVAHDKTQTAKFLGVVGALPTGDDACEVFIVATEDQKRFPKLFVTDVRRVLDHAKAHFDRIVALGEDTPFYERWFTWLGFSKDGRRGVNGILWAMRGRS